MAGRFYVPSPAFSPYPYGLLSVASLVDEADPHWRGGTHTELQSCAPASLTLEGCVGVTPGADPTEREKTIARGVTLVESDPFTLYSGFNCSAGGRDEIDMRERAGIALANGEARTLERVLEVGYSDLNGESAPAAGLLVDPNLVAATETVTAAASSPTVALGALEAALGLCYGGVGVIHANRGIVTHLMAAYLVERDGARLRTGLGTLVAAGGGYKGTGPAAPPGASMWMYATGAVTVRRSAVDLPGDGFRTNLNRATNDVTIIAERTYAVTLDCCLLAAETNVTI